MNGHGRAPPAATVVGCDARAMHVRQQADAPILGNHDHGAQYTALHDALFDGWAGEQPLDDHLARRVDLLITARLFLTLEWMLNDWPHLQHRAWGPGFLRGQQRAWRDWLGCRAATPLPCGAHTAGAGGRSVHRQRVGAFADRGQSVIHAQRHPGGRRAHIGDQLAGELGVGLHRGDGAVGHGVGRRGRRGHRVGTTTAAGAPPSSFGTGSAICSAVRMSAISLNTFIRSMRT